MQGSMSVLNPVRRIGRTFEDFRQAPAGPVAATAYRGAGHRAISSG